MKQSFSLSVLYIGVRELCKCLGLSGLFAFTVLSPGSVYADDRDDVIKLEMDYIQDWNTSDAEKIVANYHTDYTSFGLDQKLLAGAIDTEQLTQYFESGYKVHFSFRHLDVKILQNTAIITGYLTGSSMQPDGKQINGTWRYSAVRINTKLGWEMIHSHLSELNSGTSKGS